MALAALVRYGDRLRAGIDLAGISHLETSLKAAPAIAIDSRRDEYGDERDPEMVRFLREISPVTHAEAIRKPLLVAHGANDPSVNLSEAEQIVAGVRNNGTPVWYVRVDGEGHGFDRREHSIYLMAAQILFLERFLLSTR
jgi:dipeptidyl aminopeptidase/acylaminoacyl peptidase